MTTNGNAVPVQPRKKIQTRRTKKTAAKQQISDSAFYLIALATLLQESNPGAVRELLAPAGLHQAIH